MIAEIESEVTSPIKQNWIRYTYQAHNMKINRFSATKSNSLRKQTPDQKKKKTERLFASLCEHVPASRSCQRKYRRVCETLVPFYAYSLFLFLPLSQFTQNEKEINDRRSRATFL